jgi:hypothetical protein
MFASQGSSTVQLHENLGIRDIGFSDFIHRPGIKKQTKEKHDIQFPKRRVFP